jgi:hypothetical protein
LSNDTPRLVGVRVVADGLRGDHEGGDEETVAVVCLGVVPDDLRGDREGGDKDMVTAVSLRMTFEAVMKAEIKRR